MFASSIGQHLEAYISLRESLGYKFKTQAGVLKAFDRFLTARSHEGPVTQDTAIAFATTSSAAQTYRYRRYQFVRDFADYLSIFFPDSPRLERRPFCSIARRPVPYILTDTEIAKLLTKARSLQVPNHGPLCGLTHFTILGLAASTGMRVGEIARLHRSDVHLDERTIRISKSKFGKSRLIVLHSTTVEALRRYALERDKKKTCAACEAFFVSRKLTQFVSASISDAFIKIRARAKVDKRATFHSLRHTFAVNFLLRCYREGKDVNTLLPVLATYMGHVNYTSTAYYLTVTAQLLELASTRLEKGGIQ